MAHDAARICDDAVSLRLPSNGNYTFEMDTGSLARLSVLIFKDAHSSNMPFSEWRVIQEWALPINKSHILFRNQEAT